MINKEAIETKTEQVTTKIKRGQKENLKQRAYLNSVTSIIDFTVAQLTGFIVNPFIVGGLGSSMYGTWQMLGQMTGYAKIADTRATQVLKWTVAKKREIADDEELRSDVTSAFAVTMFVVPLVLIAGAIIVWYAPYITKADLANHNLIRITCSLLVLSLVVSKLFDLYESVLRGMNLAFKRMGLRATIVAIGGSLKILVITQGYGLIGLSVVQVIISLIIGITYYFVVKKNVGWFGFGNTNFSKVVAFSKLSGWYLADTGANLLLSNSDKVLLGFITSPIVVTYYTLTLFLPNAMQGLINRMIMGVVPGIGKLLGLREYEKIEEILQKINSFTFLLTTATGVTIIIFNNSFLNAWVGEGFFAGNLANTLIMVMIIQDTFIKNDSYVISATLELRKKVYLTVVAGLLFILLGFLLVNKLQIAGLCISILIGKFLLFIGQRNILQRKINYNSIIPLFKNLQPLLIALIMIGLAGYISTFIKPVGLLKIMIFAPVTFLFSFVIFYVLGISKENKIELLKMISSIKFLNSERGLNKE